MNANVKQSSLSIIELGNLDSSHRLRYPLVSASFNRILLALRGSSRDIYVAEKDALISRLETQNFRF